MAVKILLDVDGNPVTEEKHNRPRFRVHKTFSFTGKFSSKEEFINYDKFPEDIFDVDDDGRSLYFGIVYKRVDSNDNEIKDTIEDGFLKKHSGPMDINDILNMEHVSFRIVSIVSDYTPINYKATKAKSENKDLEIKVGDDPVETFKLKRFYRPEDGIELSDLRKIDVKKIGMIFVFDKDNIDEGQCNDIDDEVVNLINSKKKHFASMDKKVEKKQKRFVRMTQKDFFKKFK